MAQQIDDVKVFVNRFVQQLLIPLATEGLLSKDILHDCVDEYAKQLLSEESLADKLEVTSSNKYKAIHPFTMITFEYLGKTWLSMEHFMQAAKYIGSDDDTEENIRTAATAELAHRRGLNADRFKKTVRGNWEDKREQEIEGALRAMFANHEQGRDILKTTDKSTIVYPHPTDSFLGVFPDGSGRNFYGELLMKLRAEL